MNIKMDAVLGEVREADSGGGNGSDAVISVSENGFFLVDDGNRIGLKFDVDGLDATRLSAHLLSLIPRIVAELYSETEYPEV